jgi:hypothetical protein
MGSSLNKQQRDAMFLMRHRTSADLRALSSSNVSEAELEDLIDAGYVALVSGSSSHRRQYRLSRKGNAWVDRNL